MWEHLWLETKFPNQCKQSNHFKEVARKKHLQMKRLGPFDTIPSHWTEAEWGLPKGRRNLHETDQQVALREFSEETGISSSDITIL